jgi:PPK2 family polyphosphate:nucleotide phosphotransferase
MDRYRITDGSGFRLRDHDPRDTSGFDGGKSDGRAELARLTTRLEELQEVFFADGRYKVLVVLQGMDTSGKGGTIKKVFEGLNPAGVRVASFKAPTSVELAHDFLWRIHQHAPANGEIVIFDRSHYEDVLVTRVHNLVPGERWRARYRHICEFERMMADEGTVIRKFFLHISSDRQARRLQARLDDPTKHWKFHEDDVVERQRWADYQDAYEVALRETATEHAPWYVVPADRKWYRDLVVCHALVDALDGLDLRYPEPAVDISGIRIV